MINDELMKINNEMRDSEMNRNSDYFREMLSDDFIFRRANRTFVTKKIYLDNLPTYTYQHLEAETEKIIPLEEHKAFAIVNVNASGIRSDGSKFGGNFKNTRFFRRCEGKWKLYAWYNEEIKPKAAEETKRETQVWIGDKQSFTGVALVHRLYEQSLPDGKKWYDVLFHPNARTFWHIHTGWQDLFITAGTALVVIKLNEGQQVNRLAAGQHIRIPPGEMHWHGSTAESYMSHIAYNQFSLPDETTYWFNEVSSEEYESIPAPKKQVKTKN